MQGTPIDYQTACLYAGQLFLETRHQLELLGRQAQAVEADLRARLGAAERDRDAALAKLLPAPKPE